MTSEPDDVEDGEFRRLPRETAPPRELEDRVVATLRQSGLVGSRRRAPFLWFAAVAAGCFAAGWFGHATVSHPGAAPDDRPLYLLLLSQLHGSALPPEDELVHEEVVWAATLRRQHQFVRAERLEHHFELVQQAGGSTATIGDVWSEPPGGFFLVRASSLVDAVALARTSPHLPHGGRITVHAVNTP